MTTMQRAWIGHVLSGIVAISCGGGSGAVDDGVATESGSSGGEDVGSSGGLDDGADAASTGGASAGSGGSDESGAPGCPDADGDGSPDAACGGDDCDDTNAEIHPGADDNDEFAWRYDTPGPTCGGPLAVDDAGVVHMLCAPQSPDVGLRHATNPTGLWTNEEIESAPATGGSIAVDANGDVHVVYFVTDAQEVRHASTSGGEWSIDVVEAGFGAAQTAVAVDTEGVVHVAYSGGYNPSEIRYATDATGSFLAEHVDDTQQVLNGTAVAIAVADDGPHVVYVDGLGALRHAARSGLGWAMENVATSGAVTSSALVVDADGTLVLVYSSSSVLVAQRDPGGWNAEEVAPTSIDHAALAIGPDGRRHVVFRDFDVTHYAVYEDGSWTPDDIESPGIPSIGVDGAGRIHVAIDRSTTASGFGYARRVPPDGIDQNCDGVDGVDADGDGFASVETGGDDCDDERDTVHPGAPDPPADGVDQNCDGEGG